MPTLNELVSDIRNIATSGENTYSFRIEDEQIAYWIAEVRSMLISQAVSKRDFLTDTWIQGITCMELIQVDASECCLLDSQCTVLRTKLKVPTTVESYLDNAIVRVTKANGDIISKSNPFEAKYNKYNKYTSLKSQWYLQSGYLYIINEEHIQYVNIYAIFENPTELAEYVNCAKEACFNWDQQYPVSLKMANDITNIVLKTKIYPFLQLPQDTTNDAANNSQIGGKLQ